MRACRTVFKKKSVPRSYLPLASSDVLLNTALRRAVQLKRAHKHVNVAAPETPLPPAQLATDSFVAPPPPLPGSTPSRKAKSSRASSKMLSTHGTGSSSAPTNPTRASSIAPTRPCDPPSIPSPSRLAQRCTSLAGPVMPVPVLPFVVPPAPSASSGKRQQVQGDATPVRKMPPPLSIPLKTVPMMPLPTKQRPGTCASGTKAAAPTAPTPPAPPRAEPPLPHPEAPSDACETEQRAENCTDDEAARRIKTVNRRFKSVFVDSGRGPSSRSRSAPATFTTSPTRWPLQCHSAEVVWARSPSVSVTFPSRTARDKETAVSDAAAVALAVVMTGCVGPSAKAAPVKPDTDVTSSASRRKRPITSDHRRSHGAASHSDVWKYLTLHDSSNLSHFVVPPETSEANRTTDDHGHPVATAYVPPLPATHPPMPLFVPGKEDAAMRAVFDCQWALLSHDSWLESIASALDSTVELRLRLAHYGPTVTGVVAHGAAHSPWASPGCSVITESTASHRSAMAALRRVEVAVRRALQKERSLFVSRLLDDKALQLEAALPPGHQVRWSIDGATVQSRASFLGTIAVEDGTGNKRSWIRMGLGSSFAAHCFVAAVLSAELDHYSSPLPLSCYPAAADEPALLCLQASLPPLAWSGVGSEAIARQPITRGVRAILRAVGQSSTALLERTPTGALLLSSVTAWLDLLRSLRIATDALLSAPTSLASREKGNSVAPSDARVNRCIDESLTPASKHKGNERAHSVRVVPLQVHFSMPAQVSLEHLGAHMDSKEEHATLSAETIARDFAARVLGEHGFPFGSIRVAPVTRSIDDTCGDGAAGTTTGTRAVLGWDVVFVGGTTPCEAAHGRKEDGQDLHQTGLPFGSQDPCIRQPVFVDRSLFKAVLAMSRDCDGAGIDDASTALVAAAAITHDPPRYAAWLEMHRCWFAPVCRRVAGDPDPST